MSASFASIGKDPASQPGQADEEVIEYVNSVVGDCAPAPVLVAQGMVLAASTSSLFVELAAAGRLYAAHWDQLDPLVSQAWKEKSFETI